MITPPGERCWSKEQTQGIFHISEAPWLWLKHQLSSVAKGNSLLKGTEMCRNPRQHKYCEINVLSNSRTRKTLLFFAMLLPSHPASDMLKGYTGKQCSGTRSCQIRQQLSVHSWSVNEKMERPHWGYEISALP